MTPKVTATVAPTGGCIVLDIEIDKSLDQVNTQIAIQRQLVSPTSSATTIFSGTFCPVFIDDGEALPNYLDFATNVYYSVTDPIGTTTIGPIMPAAQLNVFSTYLDKLLFRLFSAGISATAIPAGFNKVRVLQSMPLTMGSEATTFPFIVMNLDYESQEFTQIGEDTLASETDLNIIPLIVNRRYSLSILSHNAAERDFYKDVSIAVLYTMMPTLTKIGQDYSYNIQIANSQVSELDQKPGFYESSIMLDIMGQYNMSITTTFGTIVGPIGSVVTTISGSTNVPGKIVVFQV